MTSSALLVEVVPQTTSHFSSISLWDYIQASGLRSIVLGTSKDPNAKVTVLLVSPETCAPVLAVKAPTTEAAARAVEAEAQMLDELAHLRLGGLAQTIPRVVAEVEFEGRPAVVTTAVPGKPLTTSYISPRHTSRRDRVAADFAAAGAWLADFQQATEGEVAAIDMDGAVALRLRERFPAMERLEADLECLCAIHDRLGRETGPRTAVHGDLWFGNLLMIRGRISGVVDWEAGTTSGEPLRDLVRFAHMYALFLDRRTRAGRPVDGHPGLRASGFGAGVEFAVDGTGWFPDLFKRFLVDGLTRIGASPERWRDAALAGIAEVAALTDDHLFAQRHLELFERLATRPQERVR
jgi:aminoglycoside phosphotransferase (APT) family kinase protein